MDIFQIATCQLNSKRHQLVEAHRNYNIHQLHIHLSNSQAEHGEALDQMRRAQSTRIGLHVLRVVKGFNGGLKEECSKTIEKHS